MKLIDCWRQGHKLWSARLLGVSLIAQAIPAEAILGIYRLLPEDIASLLPHRTAIVLGLTALALIVRFIPQPKVQEAVDASTPKN